MRLAQFFVSLYMPRVGSRQASLNKLIWCTLLCYLLCSGDKIKYFFVSFNNDRGLILDDKTKDYADRNTRGQVNSLHEVTQLG